MAWKNIFMLLGVLILISAPSSSYASQQPDSVKHRIPASTVKGEVVHRHAETAPSIVHYGGITRGGDCNNNGIPDLQDFLDGNGTDCNFNGNLDECDVAATRIDYSFIIDPSEPILDGVTTRRTFTIPDDGTVTDVNLSLSLTHQFLGDIIVSLTHAGTSVELYRYGPCQGCPSTCSFEGTVFDDEAVDQLSCTEFNEGIFIPHESFSAFDGLNTQGDWTLEIFDGFIGFQGSLTEWSISIESTDNDCNLNGLPDECDIFGGESIDQWATSVLDFSSEFVAGNMAFAAIQVLGPPNTFSYCDCGTAWAPANLDGTQEFISVGFDQPVFADGITIRETQGNGYVTRIDLIDEDGNVHIAWEGVDPSQTGVVENFRINWTRTDYLVVGATVYIDTSLQLNTWEEIDAIQLHGAVQISKDCNGNEIPDECEIANGASDCNSNGIPDDCDIATLGAMVDQYASGVIQFTSEYDEIPGYGRSLNILGEPDNNPWAPLPVDGSLESITVSYPSFVFASGVTINELSAQGMVYQVDVVDLNNVLHTVWQGVDPTPPGPPADFEVLWPLTSFAVKGIKVYIDTDNTPNIRELIDSIQLHGRLAEDCNNNQQVDWCEFGLIDCNVNGRPDICDANPTHHNCCSTGFCNDETVFDCVCAIWPHCCNTWDQICVDAVEDFQCGACEPVDVDCNDNGVPDDCDIAPLGTPTDQWASFVIDFSTESFQGDLATNALGPPDGGAGWGPFFIDGSLDYLTVGYDMPVYATGVTVREEQSPGFVYQIDVLDMNNDLRTVWEGVDPGGECCGVDVEFTWPITSYEVTGVRVYVDTNTGLETTETIDAIQLQGLAGTDCNENSINDWCESDGLDCNNNGIADVCDSLDKGQGVGPGDFNGDGIVDVDDLSDFIDCMAGPGVMTDFDSLECASVCIIAFDFDEDSDIDLYDFSVLQTLFGMP